MTGVPVDFLTGAFFGAGFALGVTGVGETETVGVVGFLAAGFFFGGATTTEVTRWVSGSVVSPASEGPERPVALEAKLVRIERIAAPPATFAESTVEAVKTLAASAPTRARKVWAKVFTARSSVAVRKNVSYIICTPLSSSLD